MTHKERITISIDSGLLKRIDSYLDNLGMGSNRSGFFESISDKHLKGGL